ncbi:LrgB family protein [Fibrobacter sp.]|uniref:LrgB family protein n=1 Tax=Fibrobacter sp. TaxID=35828 RepID=UPI00388F3871
MNAIINSPLFGILLTLVAFEIGVAISKKFKYSFLNPLLIANVLIVGFLLVTGISLESYNVGGDYISVMLSPATVVLAVPLYRQISKLAKFWKPILAGIFAGSLTSLACVIAVSKLIGLSEILMLSLLPKSITIPMGSVVSEQIGGIPAVTIIAITITGITGAVAAPAVCRFCRIKHKVAQGIAIGTASHALGTTRAMEMGEVQGAMSSLSIGVAGLFTAIAAPIILNLIR